MRRLMLLVVSGAAVLVVTAGAFAAGGCVDASSLGRDPRPSESIAYFAPSEMAIYVVRPDGSHKRVLIDSVGGAPAWSRDGRQIVFITEDGAVGIAQGDGTKRRRLLIGPAFCDQPAWSPSGSEIICTASWLQETPTGHEWQNALYIGNVRSGRSRELVPRGSAPAWSPDGRRIAFEDAGIRVIDLQTHEVRTHGSGSTPDWSPDGTKIAYSTGHTIAVMKWDGSGLRTIVRSRDVVSDPSWAPDGSRIVFTAIATAGGDPSLFVVRADGSDRRPLVRGGADGDWRHR